MATAVESIPELSFGDCLSPEEFLRRWEADPTIKRAELLRGVVYMPSPVSIDHGDMESIVGTWLGTYRAFTPGTAVAHNATVLLTDDIPQPDVHLRLLPECGGRSWIEGSYLHGVPELVVEICKTSAAYDLHQKLEIYREAGVPEYIAVVLHDSKILWHRLRGGEYELLPTDPQGRFRSEFFPGLILDAPALLAKKPDRVLSTLREGLAAPEHAEFVRELSNRVER